MSLSQKTTSFVEARARTGHDPWENDLVSVLFLTEILTLQAGFFYLEACFFTNKMPNPFGTSKKLTIQAG